MGRKLLLHHYRSLIAIVLFVFITGWSVFFWVNAWLVKRAVVAATQQRLEVIARAGATSIESLLSTIRTELLYLASEEEIVSMDIPRSRVILLRLIGLWDQPIVRQLGLVARDGTLLITANKEDMREDEGISLIDRSYFQWAIRAKTGEVFVSEPIISRAGINKGKWIIMLATPIVSKDGKFAGALLSSLRLEDIRKFYVDRLVPPPGAAYIVNSKGMTVSTPFEPLLGINVRSYAREKQWKGYETYLSMIDGMTSAQEEGKSVYWFMGSDSKVVKWINGYAPVRMGTQNIMTIAVAAPYDTVNTVLQNFFTNQSIGLVFLIVATVGIAFLWLMGFRIAKHDGFNIGLLDGDRFRKHKK